MSPTATSPLSQVKALTFDVFGTVVDWRQSVVDELTMRAFRKVSSDLPPTVKSRLEELTQADWEEFAQQWRNMYGQFTRSFNPETDEWKTIDEHHRESLVVLIEQWGLNGVYTDQEITSLSLVWHRLVPWPDSAEGIQKLGTYTKTSTLSNGTIDLLKDLNDFGNLGFNTILSSENFKAYKPNPAVYLGAVEKLGLQPAEVAMTAAHLNDLEAARSHGLRTIYIERPQEEAWPTDSEKYQEAKKWVDLWVDGTQNGILTAAELLKQMQ